MSGIGDIGFAAAIAIEVSQNTQHKVSFSYDPEQDRLTFSIKDGDANTVKEFVFKGEPTHEQIQEVEVEMANLSMEFIEED